MINFSNIRLLLSPVYGTRGVLIKGPLKYLQWSLLVVQYFREKAPLYYIDVRQDLNTLFCLNCYEFHANISESVLFI